MDNRTFRPALLSALLVPALVLLASAPAPAQAPADREPGAESLDSGTGAAPPAEEDTSVYTDAPVAAPVIRNRGSSITLFWSGAYSASGAGTLSYDGTLDLDGDGVDETDQEYEADGEYALALLRSGIRFEFGRRVFKFRLALFGQRMFGRFLSDGRTDVDYINHPVHGTATLTGLTVSESFDALGGGLEVGFQTFLPIHLARRPEGVSQFTMGPLIGLVFHLSGGYDDGTSFGGGYAGLDLDLGWKFQILNRLSVYLEFGVYGGFAGGTGGGVKTAVSYNACWKLGLGFGLCL